MATLDRLPADQRAVLQLVLQRRRSYDDIAAMLAIDRAAVRERALGALDALGPQSDLDPVRRGLITDYLLGQLPSRVAEDVKARLATTPGERAWARVVAGELAPLSGEELPEIPSAPAAAAPAPAAPPAAAEAPLDETARDPAGARIRSAPPAPEPRRRQSQPRSGAPAADRRSGAILLAAGVLAVIVAVVLVIVLTSSGSAKHSSTAASVSTSATTSTSSTSSGTASARPVAQVNLTSPTGSTRTGGVAIVVRQGNQEGLVIRAQGIPANSKHDAYAVWLNTPGGASAFLGFVNPGVGSSGVLQTAGVLPAGAARYTQLLVTRETQAKPKAPGTIILQGALKLSS